MSRIDTRPRNIVAEKLARDEIVTSCIVKFVQTVSVASLIKTAGFDAFYVDLEHCTFSLDLTSQICVTALALGVTPFVRVPAIDGDFISRVLDGGAMGVIGPHIETAEDAERLVRYAKYPPYGKRGAGGGLPHFGFARLPADEMHPLLNELTTVATMIETASALENVEAIADVEGVDILVVGCSDLSSELGVPGKNDHPRIEEAVMTTIAAARKRGKHVWLGGLAGKMELVSRLMKAGARAITTGSDIEILTTGFNARAKSTDALKAELRGQ